MRARSWAMPAATRRSPTPCSGSRTRRRLAGPAHTITLVTGASSGIGAALAKRMARHGDHVILVARRVRLLQEVAAEITSAGGSSEIAVCDVTIGEAARNCVAEVLRK